MQAQGDLLKAKKNTLSHAQLFQLGDYIRQHCANFDGFAIYHEGWSDHVITKAFQPFPITLGNVQHARESAVGPLPPKPPADTTLEALALRVATLETLVKGLTK